MDQLGRFLPSFPRFPNKQSGESSDSDIRSEQDHHTDTQQTEETRLKQDQKSEERQGIVNMAYSKTHGDDQEERDMGSIFKSFNNFTNRFRFTADKIEETKPDSNYGTFSEKPPKDSEETTYQSDTTTQHDKTRTTEPVQSPTKQNGVTISPEHKPKKGENEPKKTEVPTIVTAPVPISPEKKSGVDKVDGDHSDVMKRRSTDNILFFEGATLSPEIDMRRRHSTDVVSVPKPLNEELVLEDMKKRGTPFKRRSTKKSHLRENNRRESYSPRMERKQRKDSPQLEIRRKTLAELALESGYKAPKMQDIVDGEPSKEDKTKTSDKVITASDSKSPMRISGELYITLEYCMETKTFIVHVHTANNIAAVDHKRQTSDPYVKTYLLPDKRSKRKTKTIRDDLNPEFDEVIKYHIGYDELLTRTLSLTIWNDDLFGKNDFLGEVVIPIEQFVEQGNSLENSVAKWYSLGEKVDHDSEVHPEIIVALKYMTGDKVKKKTKKGLPSKGELQLQVLEAKNLPGKDADGMSDPFCKIFLLPDKKGKTKHQTKKIDRTLNPVWNHRLSYEDLSIEELYDRVLELTVWDHDMMSRDEFLGGVRLGTGEGKEDWDDSSEDEAQIWHTMLNRTNVWIQVVIPLRPNMETRKNI